MSNTKITAKQILQKHVPNAYPNSNGWLDAMEEYAAQQTDTLKTENEELKEKLRQAISNKDNLPTRERLVELLAELTPQSKGFYIEQRLFGAMYVIDNYGKSLSGKMWNDADMIKMAKYGYEFRDTTSFPGHKFEDSCINNSKQYLQSLQSDNIRAMQHAIEMVKEYGKDQALILAESYLSDAIESRVDKTYWESLRNAIRDYVIK